MPQIQKPETIKHKAHSLVVSKVLCLKTPKTCEDKGHVKVIFNVELRLSI